MQGHDAIRCVWDGFVAMDGQLEVTTQYAVVQGEVALLSNRWTMRIGDDEMSATTAEVARRQPDGTWRYLIDNPDGAGGSGRRRLTGSDDRPCPTGCAWRFIPAFWGSAQIE